MCNQARGFGLGMGVNPRHALECGRVRRIHRNLFEIYGEGLELSDLPKLYTPRREIQDAAVSSNNLRETDVWVYASTGTSAGPEPLKPNT